MNKRFGTGVIQPIGNEDAYRFLAATKWPNPAAIAAGERWMGVSRATCAPKRPNFYQNYPGARPANGPVEPHVDPFPNGSKGYPGGPMLHDGNGGYVAPHAQMPSESVGRGVSCMPTTPVYGAFGAFGSTTWQDIKDDFMGGLSGALGAATAVALIAYLGFRARG